MSTTSLKLSDELKSEIQHFAAEENLSAHAFMVRALEAETVRRRQRADFVAQATQALNEAEAGGPVYDADEMFEYLKARMHARTTGTAQPARPKPMRGGLPAMRTARAA